MTYKFGNKTVEITSDDFDRLDDGEFLNDTVIDFYLTYIHHSLPESVANSTYIFNTFFYKRLTQKASSLRSPYENVKKWTSKVDILGMKHLVIPIHEHSHWYVAVVCNLGKLGATENSEISKGDGTQHPKSPQQTDSSSFDLHELLDSEKDEKLRKQTISTDE